MLQPSRRDTTTPPRPGTDGADLSPAVRHHGSYLRSLDPGIQGGRFAKPRPPRGSGTPLLVGTDEGGDGNERLWEYDDRGTVTVATGTQLFRLSHEPFEESLFVRWHPDGRGGVPVLSEDFEVEDQTVIITNPGVLAVGDVFSFQYEYEDTEDALDFEFIAAVVGVFHYPENTLTFTPPPEMQAGDFLVAAVRGSGAPGGGDITLGVTSGDSRLSMFYSATLPVVEGVLTGFATGSTADVVTNIIPNPSFLPGARGVMLILRGVNAVDSYVAVESGTTTPVVPAAAAVAVTWVGNSSFIVQNAGPPDGYTEGHSTGLDYTSTDLSYWSDPAGLGSPAGAFVGEGCLIMGLS